MVFPELLYSGDKLEGQRQRFLLLRLWITNTLGDWVAPLSCSWKQERGKVPEARLSWASRKSSQLPSIWEPWNKTMSLGPCLCVSVCLITQSSPTLCNPMGCSLPGSSVHGILQARILEWVAISFWVWGVGVGLLTEWTWRMTQSTFPLYRWAFAYQSVKWEGGLNDPWSPFQLWSSEILFLSPAKGKETSPNQPSPRVVTQKGRCWLSCTNPKTRRQSRRWRQDVASEVTDEQPSWLKQNTKPGTGVAQTRSGKAAQVQEGSWTTMAGPGSLSSSGCTRFHPIASSSGGGKTIFLCSS